LVTARSIHAHPTADHLRAHLFGTGMRHGGNRIVAMLLRTDFDQPVAARIYCPMFAKKVVLTKRIRWFEDSNGSPSFNHCWMIWDQQHRGPPS
jgi:hypothetical protein